MVWPARSAVEQADLLLGAGPARGEHRVDLAAGDDGDAVAVADDPVPRVHVDAADRRVAADLARQRLRRARQGDQRAEHREAESLQRFDVAHAAVDHQAGDAARLRRGREHLTPVAELGFVADVDDEHACRPVPPRPRRARRGCRRACSAPGTRAPRCAHPATRREMRARIGRPPLSPSVAAPSSATPR